ncbi:MAG: YqgE/AlgH family protein [Opitutales bacterium]|nr:YqgE/AlgH family protein [Opitutales bacterium]NRA27211.1 YqgE/AlgH family protein [Opitutales bacterium]
MRNSEFGQTESVSALAGSLLLAHPELKDPNFNKSVVLISAHSTDDGALGVILNRPMGQSLAQFDGKFSYTDLADVPLYVGGPASPDQMILTAWQWHLEQGRFQLHFGINPDKARELISHDPEIELRGFVGYSGWSQGQLEGELEQDSWVVTPVSSDALEDVQGDDLWRTIIREVSPEMRFLADAPDDPSVN